MKRNKCPCCGAPIKVGQEECLKCRVYLWPAEKDRVKHGMGEITAESAIKALHDAALRVSADDYDKLKPMLLLSTLEEIVDEG
jgi:hypothetical protein